MTEVSLSSSRRLQQAAIAIVAAVFVYLVFAFFVLNSAEHRFLDFDSAYHASVSKNIANGYGYATSYDRKIWLNPDITTGSTLIVPFASFFKYSHKDVQAPLVFAACLNIALIGVLLLLLGFRLKHLSSLVCFVFSLLLLLMVWEPKWLTAFTADMPVILFLSLVVGLLTLDNQRYSKLIYLFIGVFLALALKAKMTALIGFVVLLPALFYQLLFRRKKPTSMVGLIFILGGFFLAFFPLKTIENQAFSRLTPVEQQQHRENKKRFILEHDSTGLQVLIDAPDKIDHFANSIRLSDQVLSANFKRYGLPRFMTPLLFFFVLMVFCVEIFQLRRQGVSASLLFSALSLAYAGWYFLFCFSYAPKYPYTPVIFAFIALLLFLSSCRKGAISVLLVGAFVAFLPAEIWQSLKQDYWLGNPEQELYNQDLKDVSRFIQQSRFDAPVVGCGWHIAPRSVEYLLPSSENFKDCFRILGDSLEPVKHAANRFRWIDKPSFYVLIDLPLALYNKQDRALRKPLQKICRREPVYRSKMFLVLECPNELIVANLKLNATQAGKFYQYSHMQ